MRAARAERVEWIEDLGRFTAIAPEWDRLAERAGNPFARHAWLAAWWEAFGQGARPAVCVVWRGGDLAAALPLAAHRGRLRGWADDHTSVLGLAAADEAAMAALARAVVAAPQSALVVPALDAGGHGLAALGSAAAAAGRRTHVEPQHVCPIVETAGDVALWRALSKPRWGAPLERFGRKMRREHEASFALVTAPEAALAELERGLRVEASGWKGRAGTAILSQPETARFYRTVAGAFHERGELRLSSISLDGRMVAFDLCVLSGGTLYLVKTGFDEQFRRLAPGLVLRLAVVERCFADGIAAHDLLGGDSGWKRKFATTERRHACLFAFRTTATGAAGLGYRRVLRPRLRELYDRAQRTRARRGKRPGSDARGGQPSGARRR